MALAATEEHLLEHQPLIVQRELSMGQAHGGGPHIELRLEGAQAGVEGAGHPHAVNQQVIAAPRDIQQLLLQVGGVGSHHMVSHLIAPDDLPLLGVEL